MPRSVDGLEDQSKYPNLIAEMFARGWTDEDVIGLMGGNIMRVMDEVDEIQKSLVNEEASSAVYEERQDLPAPWGGEDDTRFSEPVRAYLKEKRRLLEQNGSV